MSKLIPGIALTVATLLSSALQAGVITQWTFEGDVTTASTGTGTASLVGGTSATFATGNGGGRGWNTTTYAAQSTGSGTRGVQFLASTVGFEDITVSYDHRASSTASRWAQLEYTLNGTTWNVFDDNAGGLSPDGSFFGFNFDLTSIAGANNNANFGARILSIFSPDAFDQNATLADFAANSAYMRANAEASYNPGGGTGTGNYGTTGTWRFDNVTFNGTAVPEPTSYALLGLIGGVGVYRARRRPPKDRAVEPTQA